MQRINWGIERELMKNVYKTNGCVCVWRGVTAKIKDFYKHQVGAITGGEYLTLRVEFIVIFLY